MSGRSTSRRAAHRRGMAVVVAIVLMGLIATTLAVLATYLISDARQVGVDRNDAQLRELLTAGAATAISQSSQEPLAPMDVPIPADLSIDSASVSIEPHTTANETSVIIRARLGDSSREETLHLTANGTRWKIVSVD